jgi:hypothetical protein
MGIITPPWRYSQVGPLLQFFPSRALLKQANGHLDGASNYPKTTTIIEEHKKTQTSRPRMEF